MPDSILRLALCGDVMTGRGIDQILPHPSNPQLHEPVVSSALRYVELAEEASGAIDRPVSFDYVWGDLPALLRRERPDIFIANLETSVTRHAEPAPKGINYRMNPANLPCLKAGGIDCCTLANNHVLDWGQVGLLETLDSLGHAGIAYAGAGRDGGAAEAPAIMKPATDSSANGTRVILFGFGFSSSGIPTRWAAGRDRPGVNLLPDYSDVTIDRISSQVHAVKRSGDTVVASLHWGGNWGYDIDVDAQRFARQLIAVAGVDLVHGHSSHHAKGIELFSSKLILHGCGDFLNDYEGITGYDAFRADLALLYFADIEKASGALLSLTAIPFRIRKLRLNRATTEETDWLQNMLTREGEGLGTAFASNDAGAIRLIPRP